MTTLIPVFMAIAYAFAMYRISVWRSAKTLNENSHPLREPEITAMAQRLARALDLTSIQVHVYAVDPVNGLAAPDGRIFLTEGFLRKYRAGEVTAAELASVIAHELGHVALGHTRRRMIDVTGANAVFMMASALLSRFLPIIGIWLANLLSTALMARISRKDEFEADAYASALLVKAGIGTAAQKSLFRKLDALVGHRGTTAPEWLLSHPRTPDRIAAIEANEARWNLG
ncbi:M48 family metallopeptidase [Gemmobacter fulvus]|uniref:M48 family metallopeptidase n=1 Tax=Gemmobacter fulvus TaxID=2840474 RepID=A0A975P5Q4_9RHOB|nr:M48 family metallopeptidase [Gemmobacter fulvus]MBT9245344.1 M48 family metallopeptidase [Gemmobacter fulvus]MDQ1848215.1 M48 family metallopeptidase [Gemmobacter fulvus]QWK90339.1 M48 family metallopeptidase [Gemmobacter fulvus]